MQNSPKEVPRGVPSEEALLLPQPLSVRHALGRTNGLVWAAPGKARGCVLLVPGLWEHAGYFVETGARVAQRFNVNVVSFDRFGTRHSLPDGVSKPANVAASQQHQLVEVASQLDKGPLGPVLAVSGHSLGGSLVARAGGRLATECSTLQGLGFEAPALLRSIHPVVRLMRPLFWLLETRVVRAAVPLLSYWATQRYVQTRTAGYELATEITEGGVPGKTAAAELCGLLDQQHAGDLLARVPTSVRLEILLGRPDEWIWFSLMSWFVLPYLPGRARVSYVRGCYHKMSYTAIESVVDMVGRLLGEDGKTA